MKKWKDKHYYQTSLFLIYYCAQLAMAVGRNCLLHPITWHSITNEKEDRCLHVALPVAAFLEMLTTSVTTRATTSTRAGCVQRGMGQTTPFSGRGSRNAAEDDPRPNIIQLNTEGLTDNKISVIDQLAQWFLTFFPPAPLFRGFHSKNDECLVKRPA